MNGEFNLEKLAAWGRFILNLTVPLMVMAMVWVGASINSLELQLAKITEQHQSALTRAKEDRIEVAEILRLLTNHFTDERLHAPALGRLDERVKALQDRVERLEQRVRE
jgi:hypothetical protein